MPSRSVVGWALQAWVSERVLPRDSGQGLHGGFHRKPEIREGTGDALGPTHVCLRAFPVQRHRRGANARGQLAEIESGKPEPIRVRQ